MQEETIRALTDQEVQHFGLPINSVVKANVEASEQQSGVVRWLGMFGEVPYAGLEMVI